MRARFAGLLFLAVGVAFGTQDAPPEATFRTGVKLVQVSVIAQDKNGKPVADLRREEFHVLDNGSPQEIRLFLNEAERSPTVTQTPSAPGTFSNRIATPAGSRGGGYSVILIDNLFTDFGDPFADQGSGNARKHALQMLRSIPVGEKIAIYAEGRQLQVICEFTSDRDMLERQLQLWVPKVDTPITSGGILGPTEANASERVRSDAARIDALQRAASNNDEMEQLADHLSGIPGRKNLIWLSVRFVAGGRALQKLSNAGVSIYPVDLDGVCYACTPPSKQLLDGIAAQTGGVAYYGRNDIDVAMREAMDDGRVSYTLGFYESDDDRKSQVHQFSVKVSRPGVTLRYRTSYQTEGPKSSSAATKTDLVKALLRPVDATAIAIDASITRANDRLTLDAMLDVANLDLALSQNRWTGKIEVVAHFAAADGSIVGDRLSQTIDLHLRQPTYQAILDRGFVYRNDLKIPAKAVELKLLVANLATGRIGTLTIPLAGIVAVSAKAK